MLSFCQQRDWNLSNILFPFNSPGTALAVKWFEIKWERLTDISQKPVGGRNALGIMSARNVDIKEICHENQIKVKEQNWDPRPGWQAPGLNCDLIPLILSSKQTNKRDRAQQLGWVGLKSLLVVNIGLGLILLSSFEKTSYLLHVKVVQRTFVILVFSVSRGKR